MKKLYLVRHAKTEWQDPKIMDFDRLLTKKGQHDADRMAKVLVGQNIKPDILFTSAAKRAVETSQIMTKIFELADEKLVINPAIYEASAQDLLDIVSQLDDSLQTVMLVGHNPTLSHLVVKLCDVAQPHLPSCSVYGIAFDQDSWKEASEQGGKNIFFDCPRNHDE